MSVGPAGAHRRPHPAPADHLPARPGRLHRRLPPARGRPAEARIGLKDGHGDLDRLQRLTLAAPDDFLFFNGAATAEIQARAYATVGVPRLLLRRPRLRARDRERLLRRLRDGDAGTVDKLLRGFYVPFVELRDRVPGYAVSLVKAAARLRGHPVGPVRAPLTDPSAADLADLRAVLAAGLDLVGAAL
ncbi:5-dehydro-4-deoxyglucarate dehydratase [Streptomyces griseomycini]